jgi:hypothetical protein
MSNPIPGLGAALAALSLSTAALAAGNTPIQDDRQALRSVLTGYVLSAEAAGHVTVFSDLPRSLAEPVLLALSGVTTPAALAAVPAGITVPCAVSGSIFARVTPGPVRVLRIEWLGCRTDPSFNAVANGPAELLFTGNSFAPAALLSLRLGDRLRDVTVDMPVTDNPRYGGSHVRWNVRIGGILPLRPAGDLGFFPGRLSALVDGIYEVTDFIRNRPDLGPPFYPQIQLFAAQSLVIRREQASTFEDNRILLGSLDYRFQSPTTPTRTGRTYDLPYRYWDFQVKRTYAPSEPSAVQVNGRAQTRLGEFYGFTGCPTETFSYRTLTPWQLNPATFMFDTGTLAVNDDTIAEFSISGTEPFVDLLGHIDIGVQGLGDFHYTAQFSFDELYASAACTP